MKGDTVLDLVVFELTAPRTRCELYVSARGTTEKLASGFLKPFLNHLRAVEEQVARGCEFVKLECPQTDHGKSWFTKGTLERFVRFVSTPEVLERVKSIEDEVVQLEQVRSIQGSDVPQADDPFLEAVPIRLRKDGQAISQPMGISGGSKPVGNFIQTPTRFPYDIVESGTEASKVELLRAMDVRLVALRQEQSTAFGRAAAAGFHHGNMTDLMTFSEYFGADRLRVACTNFLLVCQRRVVGSTEPNLQSMASGCDLSSPNPSVLSKIEGLPLVCASLSQKHEAHMPNAKHSSQDDGALVMKDALLPAQIKEIGFDVAFYNKKGDIEPRKRWGPPMNIRSELFSDRNPINSENLSKTSASQLDLLSNKQMSTFAKPNPRHVGEHDKGVILTPTRRLSVQDAISMFEEKKRQELARAPGIESVGKQECGEVSLEGVTALSSGIAVQTWSGANGGEVGEFSQGRQESRKGQSTILLPKQDSNAVKSAGDRLFSPLSATLKPKESSGKICASKEQSLGATFAKSLENNLKDSIRRKLEGSATQVIQVMNPTAKQGLSKGDSGLSMSCDKNHSAKPEVCESRSREPETVDLSIELQQPISTQEHTISGRSALEIDAVQFSPASSEIRQANMIKEEPRKDVGSRIHLNSEAVANQSSGSEVFGSSRAVSFHFGITDHINILDKQASMEVEDVSKQRSSFYEKYTKLRDAKLMEEKDNRRAQREAKLRVMEETLSLRKAELDAQAMKQLKINHQQARAAKLQARRADFYIMQLDKEDGVRERYGEISGLSNGCTLSPPLTLLAGKEQSSTSNSRSGRKAALGSAKGATPPQSSIRGSSVSPKLTPRSAIGSTTKPRRSVSSSMIQNPLAKSVSSFASWRKENTKPSECSSASSANFSAVSEACPLESHVNALVCTPQSASGPIKEDKEHGSSPPRKSSAHMKIKSTSSDGDVLVPLCIVQGEVDFEATAFSKQRFNDAAFLQEDMQSAEKGSKYEPVQLLDMIQQLSFPTVEAASGVNTDRASLFLKSSLTDVKNQISEKITGISNQRDANNMEYVGNHAMFEADVVPGLGRTNSSVSQKIATDGVLGERGLQLEIHERAHRTKSSPINIAAASPSEADLREDLECHLQSQFRNDIGNGVPSQFPDGSGDGLLVRRAANESTLFYAKSLPNKLQSPVFLYGSASPPNSRVAQACEIPGDFSPLPIDSLESPSQRGADWKLPQAHHATEAEINQSNKKWTDSQKLVSTKEPAKGFKKLLSFSRKAHAHDAASADWVLASGEEEIKDHQLATDDVSARGTPEEMIMFGRSGEDRTIRSRMSATASLRSSIPAPPSNYRLRDDHLMGGSMLKAPRSFFSLSSLRTKSVEGKAL